MVHTEFLQLCALVRVSVLLLVFLGKMIPLIFIFSSLFLYRITGGSALNSTLQNTRNMTCDAKDVSIAISKIYTKNSAEPWQGAPDEVSLTLNFTMLPISYFIFHVEWYIRQQSWCS